MKSKHTWNNSRPFLFVAALMTLGIALLVGSCSDSSQLATAQQPTLVQPAAAQQSTLTVTPTTFLPLVMRSPTPTPTAPSTPGSAVSFPIGPGGSDVIPHQIVRTADDRVYIFVSQQYAGDLRVYWTTAAGLPNNAAAFAGSTQTTESGLPLSLDAVYDGGAIVHVLVNTNAGFLKDYPFDLTQNTFKSTLTLASGNPTVAGDYVGTSGVSGMVDANSTLQMAYWASGNHIIHRAYTYNSSTNTLTPVGSATQVDISGSANHPALAVSPLDNSLTVAWVSQATTPKKILARTRTSDGTWGNVQTVSTAPVWTSTSSGINIDQGPSLVIGSNGAPHLTYIEDYDNTGNYGRIHYATNSGSGWTDQALNAYSHDPALALNSAGEIYIIGHGHPNNSSCKSMDDICTLKKTGTSWGSPQLFAVHSGSNSFDGSPSVKWSVVGFNRPETIEFIFFSILGDYNHPTIHYGRLP